MKTLSLILLLAAGPLLAAAPVPSTSPGTKPVPTVFSHAAKPASSLSPKATVTPRGTTSPGRGIASKTPRPVRTPRFVKPPSPEILITHAIINGKRMWQVEVLEGRLVLKNYTILKKGSSMPLTEGQIEWTIGQIVRIGADGVKAGGREWPAGTSLFMDERGRFIPIWTKPRPAQKGEDGR